MILYDQLLNGGGLKLGGRNPPPSRLGWTRCGPFEAGGSVYPEDFIKLSLPPLCLIKATAKSRAALLPPAGTRHLHQMGFSFISSSPPPFQVRLASPLGAGLPVSRHEPAPSRPPPTPPTVPSIIATKPSTGPTKLHLTHTHTFGDGRLINVFPDEMMGSPGVDSGPAWEGAGMRSQAGTPVVGRLQTTGQTGG